MSYVKPDDPRLPQGKSEEERKHKISKQRLNSGSDTFSQFTLAAMEALIREDGWQAVPHCKSRLLEILNYQILANIPKTADAKAHAIYTYVTQRMTYAPDAPGFEKITSPCAMIQSVEQARALGDCDDFAVLLATFFRLAGLKTRLMAVSNGMAKDRPIPDLDHVFAQVWVNGKWTNADPVAPHGVQTANGQFDPSWSGHRKLIQAIN